MVRVGKIISFFILLVAFSTAGWSQACTTLGQNPFSAFPVCGSTNFSQQTVPSCGFRTIPTFCPKDGNIYIDLNPFWYKFTCYTAGTLAIVITPNNLTDDYDWQLFDITGHDPSDVYTDTSLVVCYNWSGESGVTGTSATATGSTYCGSTQNGPKIPLFSKMPTLVAGHEYLLMISHFSGNNQSGYTLSFPVGGAQGATASIVNPVVPAIKNTYAVCDGTEIVVKLTTRINCNTIAKDGSDFSVSGPGPINILSASGNGCSTGFDSDSIFLKLGRILSPGTYTVTAKTGTDGNTLADNCATGLPVGANASLRFISAQPTPIDSINPVICIKDTLQLVFNKPMNCNSIAADGSDFVITGPAAVTIKSAAGVCSNGVSTVINIILVSPIRTNGTFTIHLKNGSDGNTLIDECGMITPAGSTLSFTTKDITAGDFQPVVGMGCKSDTLFLSHNGNGAANQWQWIFDGNALSNAQSLSLVSKAFGSHIAKLTVTNGRCTDTASKVSIFPDHTVKAAFACIDSLCPTDAMHFINLSSSNSSAWQWNFGNGVTSSSQNPPDQSYALTGRSTEYTVRLSATNSFQCSDTTFKLITVLASCYIAVPTAFTPNGDGVNDYLYPLNAYTASNLVFRVYNRFGQVVFETKDWTRKWNGKVKGQPQDSGTYVWTLDYTDPSGKKIFLKGTTVLIR